MSVRSNSIFYPRTLTSLSTQSAELTPKLISDSRKSAETDFHLCPWQTIGICVIWFWGQRSQVGNTYHTYASKGTEYISKYETDLLHWLWSTFDGWSVYWYSICMWFQFTLQTPNLGVLPRLACECSNHRPCAGLFCPAQTIAVRLH